MKLIIAALAAFMIATAPAVAIDAPDDNQAIVAPFVYDGLCEPISDKVKDHISFYTQALTDQEARRAIAVDNIKAHEMGIDNFCRMMKPFIDKMDQ
jgi:hypothetical protein